LLVNVDLPNSITRGGYMPMPIATILLEKLQDIKTAIEKGEPRAIPPILVQAEACILQMERELMVEIREKERLRRAA
jgi:hypothetical protein